MFDKLDFDKLESYKLKMEQFTDDILIEQFLPLAITNNKYLYPYIDKMISDIDITEEIYFKSLDLYNNNKEILTLENFLSVESSKYIKKCYILMKMDELDSNSNNILILIKKGYKELYNRFNNHFQNIAKNFMSKFFDMNDSFCMPKNKFNMHDIVSEYIILKYLSVKSNKTLPYEIEYLGKSYAMTLDFSIKTTESFSSINQIFANIISNESIDNYSAIIGLNHVSKEDRISLDNVKANMERNVLKEWSEMGVTLDIVEDLDTAIQNYDIHIYILMTIFQSLTSFGISKGMLTELKYSKREYEDIIKKSLLITYQCSLQDNFKISSETKIWIIFYNIVLKVITDDYFKARNDLNNLKRNDVSNLFIDKIEHLTRTTEELQKELNSSKYELNIIKDNNVKLQQQYLQLLNEHNKLNQAFKTEVENKKEIVALREFLFEQINNEKDVRNVVHSNDEIIKFLNSKSIVILGGHINWINKLKKILPAIRHVDIEKRLGDLSFLSKPQQIIFFNTAFNSHSFYNKFIAEMRKNDNLLYFLNHTGSINKSIDEMYRFIKSNE